MRKRILLKISGEWLKNSHSFICLKKLRILMKQVKKFHENYNIAIVLGGGNIFRGKISSEIGLSKVQGDFAGMLSTVVNGSIIKDYFNNNNLNSVLYCSFLVDKIAKKDKIDDIKKDFDSGKIVIFTGGTGMPFFTTDSCAAIRAAQLEIDTILFGKNGTNGVYDSDPKTNEKAKFIKSISFKEIIDLKLNAIDLTAATICMENKINAILFDIDGKDSFINALNKNSKRTYIKS